MSGTPVITAEAMRQCEAANFAAHTADALDLMAIAGRGCAERFVEFFAALPKSARRQIVVLAGHGNNGGDGVVMANALAEELLPGVPVEIQFAAPAEKLSSSAAFYLAKLSPKVKVSSPDAPHLPPNAAVIDALLGTGIKPPLRAPYDRWIAALNAARRPVFAVDLPSGLGCKTAVRADLTATIGFFKDSLFTPDGIYYAGRLARVPLPLPIAPEIPADVPCAIDEAFYRATERPLPASAHKYSRGAVLIAGGSAQYPHAPVLSSLAALRTGAGLVTLALPDGAALPQKPLALIARNLPGEMGAFSADSLAEFTALSAKARAVAVGPGLGRKDSSLDFVRGALALPQPLILDADALYFAAQLRAEVVRREGVTILTPHEGEAARLAQGANVAAATRIGLAQKLANTYRAVVVLKGPRTVLAAPACQAVLFNTSGTPALATAGSGDVLTGMIAAEIAANDDDALVAAARAVYLHGRAGELAAERFGAKGVIADDLPKCAAIMRRTLSY